MRLPGRLLGDALRRHVGETGFAWIGTIRLRGGPGPMADEARAGAFGAARREA